MFLTLLLWTASCPGRPGQVFCLCPCRGHRKKGLAAHAGGAAGGLKLQICSQSCLCEFVWSRWQVGTWGDRKRGEEQCDRVCCYKSCLHRCRTWAWMWGVDSCCICVQICLHAPFQTWSLASVPTPDPIHHSAVSVWLSWACGLWYSLTSWGQIHACARYFYYFTHSPASKYSSSFIQLHILQATIRCNWLLMTFCHSLVWSGNFCDVHSFRFHL